MARFYLIHGVENLKIPIHLSQDDQLVCNLMSIMPGIKEVKHSTKTASSDSKSEDLHDDRQNSTQNSRTALNQVI